MSITRRLFLRNTAVAVAVVVPAIAEEAAFNRPVYDDGPLLADDVTGTTAYADWEARRAKS